MTYPRNTRTRFAIDARFGERSSGRAIQYAEPWRQMGLVPVQLLNDMIRQGWGDTPRPKIPGNWREVEGPSRFRFTTD